MLRLFMSMKAKKQKTGNHNHAKEYEGWISCVQYIVIVIEKVMYVCSVKIPPLFLSH